MLVSRFFSQVSLAYGDLAGAQVLEMRSLVFSAPYLICYTFPPKRSPRIVPTQLCLPNVVACSGGSKTVQVSGSSSGEGLPLACACCTMIVKEECTGFAEFGSA
jgi:hypothetical protein